MTISFTRYNHKSESQIASFESLVGHRLPSDFRRFIRDFDGATAESNIFEFGNDLDAAVDYFIPLEKLQATRESISVGSRCIFPIALLEGGDYACLDFRNGSVFVWLHEFDDLVPVAKSFADFLDLLKPFDTKAADLPKPSSVWVDPDFKPDFS